MDNNTRNFAASLYLLIKGKYITQLSKKDLKTLKEVILTPNTKHAIKAPQSSGKTTLIKNELIDALLKINDYVLLITPLKALTEQTYQAIVKNIDYVCSMVSSSHNAVSVGELKLSSRLIITTFSSAPLIEEKIKKSKPNSKLGLIIDEVHEIPKSSTYSDSGHEILRSIDNGVYNNVIAFSASIDTLSFERLGFNIINIDRTVKPKLNLEVTFDENEDAAIESSMEYIRKFKYSTSFIDKKDKMKAAAKLMNISSVISGDTTETEKKNDKAYNEVIHNENLISRYITNMTGYVGVNINQLSGEPLNSENIKGYGCSMLGGFNAKVIDLDAFEQFIIRLRTFEGINTSLNLIGSKESLNKKTEFVTINGKKTRTDDKTLDDSYNSILKEVTTLVDSKNEVMGDMRNYFTEREERIRTDNSKFNDKKVILASISRNLTPSGFYDDFIYYNKKTFTFEVNKLKIVNYFRAISLRLKTYDEIIEHISNTFDVTLKEVEKDCKGDVIEQLSEEYKLIKLSSTKDIVKRVTNEHGEIELYPLLVQTMYVESNSLQEKAFLSSHFDIETNKEIISSDINLDSFRSEVENTLPLAKANILKSLKIYKEIATVSKGCKISDKDLKTIAFNFSDLCSTGESEFYNNYITPLLFLELKNQKTDIDELNNLISSNIINVKKVKGLIENKRLVKDVVKFGKDLKAYVKANKLNGFTKNTLMDVRKKSFEENEGLRAIELNGNSLLKLVRGVFKLSSRPIKASELDAFNTKSKKTIVFNVDMEYKWKADIHREMIKKAKENDLKVNSLIDNSQNTDKSISFDEIKELDKELNDNEAKERTTKVLLATKATAAQKRKLMKDSYYLYHMSSEAAVQFFNIPIHCIIEFRKLHSIPEPVKEDISSALMN